jgi:hypothetical protein
MMGEKAARFYEEEARKRMFSGGHPVINLSEVTWAEPAIRSGRISKLAEFAGGSRESQYIEDDRQIEAQGMTIISPVASCTRAAL